MIAQLICYIFCKATLLYNALIEYSHTLHACTPLVKFGSKKLLVTTSFIASSTGSCMQPVICILEETAMYTAKYTGALDERDDSAIEHIDLKELVARNF